MVSTSCYWLGLTLGSIKNNCDISRFMKDSCKGTIRQLIEGYASNTEFYNKHLTLVYGKTLSRSLDLKNNVMMDMPLSVAHGYGIKLLNQKYPNKVVCFSSSYPRFVLKKSEKQKVKNQA